MTNRYICDILEEMRKCHETRNYSYLPGLIEEAQSLANRMEAALQDKSDLQSWNRKRREAKDEYMQLLDEANKLRAEKGLPPKEPSKY